MTVEQRDIIRTKEDPNTNIDQTKLQEAEALAAQIEAESFSKFDVDFERKASRRNDDNLTDDQLVDLFSEMKRETVAKRDKEMERFKVDKDEALLDDVHEELEAMMIEDDKEEVTGLINNAYQSRVGDASGLLDMGRIQPGALEDDEQLEDEEVEETQQEPIKYFNDSIKEKLALYRQKKSMEMLQNQSQSVESNLERLFQNFQVVTQQRHKVKLNEINEFKSEPINNGE